MRGSYRVLHCAMIVILVGGGWSAAKSQAGEGRLGRGRDLFEMTWAPTHQQNPEPDGLGPLYNERSCLACHSLGGIGGAGPTSKNIDLLSPTIRPGELPPDDLIARMQRVHPGFTMVSSIVLHKFSTNAESYEVFRNELLGVPGMSAAAASPLIVAAAPPRKDSGAPLKSIDIHDVRFVWSQRNTTALFGLGRIGRISENELKDVAQLQQRENPEVSGRFTGRFGWRGQIDELSEFVRSACATELGLNIGTHAQAVDPLEDRANVASKRKVDLTHQQCSELTAYVAALPAPRRLVPEDSEERRQATAGEEVFRNIGCAVCHRRNLGSVSGLYSDLLVHEMGSELSDPSPAPAAALVSRVSERSAYGGGSIVTVARATEDRRQEWKTPPLWGVRDSAPYLHDGRAETLEAAVLQHGGEAAGSTKRFRELPASERMQVLAFLRTLAAPDPASLR